MANGRKRKRQRGPISVILRLINPQKVVRLTQDATTKPAAPFEARQMRPAGKPEVEPGGSFAPEPEVRIITRKKKKK